MLKPSIVSYKFFLNVVFYLFLILIYCNSGLIFSGFVQCLLLSCGFIIYLIFQNFKFSKENQTETFSASIYHDLKTPLISQIKSIEIFLEEGLGSLTLEQKNLLQTMLNSCNYMKEMLFTLIDTYKYKNGILKLSYENFNIYNLVQECASEIKNFAKEKRIDILINNNLQLNPLLNADRLQVKRVIMNLLINAVNYAFKDTVIEINVENRGGYMNLSVKSKSVNIPKEILKNIFDRGVTYSSKFKNTGLGLGLYLSKQIIGAHDGKMEAYSSKDGINIFSFYIPQTVKKVKI